MGPYAFSFCPYNQTPFVLHCLSSVYWATIKQLILRHKREDIKILFAGRYFIYVTTLLQLGLSQFHPNCSPHFPKKKNTKTQRKKHTSWNIPTGVSNLCNDHVTTEIRFCVQPNSFQCFIQTYVKTYRL